MTTGYAHRKGREQDVSDTTPPRRGRGRPKYGATYVRTSIYLQRELRAALDQVAAAASLSRSQYLERLARADPLIAALLAAEVQRTEEREE